MRASFSETLSFLSLLFLLGASLIAAQHHGRKHHRKHMSGPRQQLMLDIDTYSDYHKQNGHQFADVCELLHKFFGMANQDNGIQADPNGQFMSDALPQFDDGTEFSKNRAVAGDLFENDMVLTVEQITHIINNFDRRKSMRRRKRKVLASATQRWGGGIVPYKFSENDGAWQSQIRTGMQHWETETCIRFQENGNGADYLQFIKGGGCYSSVGRIGGAQQVSIGSGCEPLGFVAHEIGHSLGFWHEQSRPDRDKYITVNSQNMVPGTQGNVAKRAAREVNDYGVAYDLGSVMHYGPKAFATSPSLVTLETKDAKYRNTIGQRARLSFIDVKQVNKAYCSQRCPNKIGCKSGGYENPNNCNECKCPEGLGGQLCDGVQPSGCGGEVVATNQWQDLSNSGGGECYWRISSNGGKIRFKVTAANYVCSDTCISYLEVKHNANFQQTGFRLCCGPAGGEVVSAKSHIIVISKNGGSFSMQFISDGGNLPAPPPAPVALPPSPPPPTPPPPPRVTGSKTQECFGQMRAPCGLIQTLRVRMVDPAGDGSVDVPEDMARFIEFDSRVKRQWGGGPPPPPWWDGRPPWAHHHHHHHHRWRDEPPCLVRFSFNCADRRPGNLLRVRFFD